MWSRRLFLVALLLLVFLLVGVGGIADVIVRISVAVSIVFHVVF